MSPCPTVLWLNVDCSLFRVNQTNGRCSGALQYDPRDRLRPDSMPNSSGIISYDTCRCNQGRQLRVCCFTHSNALYSSSKIHHWYHNGQGIAQQSSIPCLSIKTARKNKECYARLGSWGRAKRWVRCGVAEQYKHRLRCHVITLRRGKQAVPRYCGVTSAELGWLVAVTLVSLLKK